MSEKPVRAIYYYPEDADLTILKDAFSAMKTGLMVTPFAWQPGMPGPIIFIPKRSTDTFPYVLDYAIVRGPATAQSALRWALGLQSYEKGPRLMEDNLKEIFGEGVKEVGESTGHDGSGHTDQSDGSD